MIRRRQHRDRTKKAILIVSILIYAMHFFGMLAGQHNVVLPLATTIVVSQSVPTL